MTRQILFLAVLILIFPSVARPATYYVAAQVNAADDANPGTPRRPWKTLARATRDLRPGDTLVVHSGVYRETVTLKTIFGVNPDPDVDTDHYDGPDNITVSPYGGIILAENGEGIQHLVGVTAEGRAYALARNELNDSEFTGPAFSADGKILFANIQSPGHVFAITGPWERAGNARR